MGWNLDNACVWLPEAAPLSPCLEFLYLGYDFLAEQLDFPHDLPVGQAGLLEEQVNDPGAALVVESF
jgi:hypothetical protein